MKIIIIGTGFVAQAYMRAIMYLGYHPLVLSRSWFNYQRGPELKFLMASFAPDVVLNCSGYTGQTVDDCELRQQECYAANFASAVHIATETPEQCRLVHISSGCIFNGCGPFSEKDAPNFTCNAYQKAKFNAEQRVLDLHKNTWVFRIRMPFSQFPHPRNWLTKLAGYDQILDGANSVTWIDEFAMRSFQLIQKAPAGIYHHVQPGPVTTLAVAYLLDQAGLRKKENTGVVKVWNPYDFEEARVRRSATVLSPEKFEKAYGTVGTDGLEAIKHCIELMRLGIRNTTDLPTLS